jgi:hypothetical protein
MEMLVRCLGRITDRGDLNLQIPGLSDEDLRRADEELARDIANQMPLARNGEGS